MRDDCDLRWVKSCELLESDYREQEVSIAVRCSSLDHESGTLQEILQRSRVEVTPSLGGIYLGLRLATREEQHGAWILFHHCSSYRYVLHESVVFTNLAMLVGFLEVLKNPGYLFIWISASESGVTAHEDEVLLAVGRSTYIIRSKRCAPVQSHEAGRHESRNDSGDSTSLRPGML
jgi:hypothetical protein